MDHTLSKVPRLSGCCLKHRLVPVADRSKRFTIQPCPILAASLYLGRSARPICYHHAQRLDNSPAPQAPHQTLHPLPVCIVS